MKCLSLFIYIVISAFSLVSYGQNNIEPFFDNKDRICFLGNSITHGGQYHEFVQLFYATRYPNTKVSFRNCGISGDVATGMLGRLEEDVLSQKPTHVFLMAGMNDVIRTLYFKGKASEEVLKKRQEALENYFIKTDLLVTKLVKNNITPVFLTPTIYDQYSKIEKENNMGCNDALQICVQHIKGLAKKYQAAIVDFNSPMKEIMQEGLKKDSLFTIIGADRVHPGTTGHFIMAYEILATLEHASFVSKIEIDMARKSKVKTENCELSQLSKNKEGISFKCKENSLPFPLNRATNDATDYVPFMEEFNQELIKIKNLDPGVYNLTIGGVPISSYSSALLKDGINLAINPKTPQFKQAAQVMRLCDEYRKTSYQLRAVPYIKFKYLNDYRGEQNALATRAFLNKKLMPLKGKSYHGYIKKSMDEYFETLPRLDSLENRLLEIHNSIYVVNKPKSLVWNLVKNKN